MHKAIGENEDCTWRGLVTLPWEAERLKMLRTQCASMLKVVDEDASIGLQRIKTPRREFWIKKEGQALDGLQTLVFVLAEQKWIAEFSPDQSVRRGEVVMDVGAHVGTFGEDALHRGAAKVIMVEPDPVNVECIRRNFRQEIAAGIVVVVPEGAWSSVDMLEFSIGIGNSGTGGFLHREDGASTLKVPVRPIDDILRDLRITKVDYVKFDIEGAEREALKGATNLLRTAKPRLMLDAYHRPDDQTVLPQIILAANPHYKKVCGVCTPTHGIRSDHFAPYSIFFE